LLQLTEQVRKIRNVSGAGLCHLVLDVGPSAPWEGETFGGLETPVWSDVPIAILLLPMFKLHYTVKLIAQLSNSITH